MKPGTKVIVTLPFAKRPFTATISDEPCPLADCYRIIVDKPSKQTVTGKVVNVAQAYVRLS